MLAPRRLQEKGFLSKVKLKEVVPPSATSSVSRRLHPDRNFKVEDHPDHPVRRKQRLQEAWLPTLEQAQTPSHSEVEGGDFEEKREDEKEDDEEGEEQEGDNEEKVNDERHTSSSRSSSSVSDLLEEPPAARLAEMPLPVKPWCGKCEAVKAYGILPLKPGDLCSAHAHTTQLLAQYARPPAPLGWPPAGGEPRAPGCRQPCRPAPGGSPGGSPGDSLGGSPGPRRESLLRFAKTADELLADLGAIEVPDEEPKSRFSSEPRPPGEGPPVLWGMPERRIGALECWAINHVKQIHVKVAAREHFSDHRRASRHRNSIISSGVAHILTARAQRCQLDGEESAFLTGKLRFFPYLCDLPDELMPLVAKDIIAESWELGSHIFQRGDPVPGLYWLARGEVLLEPEELPDGERAEDRHLEPPAAICAQDVFEQATAAYPGASRWLYSALWRTELRSCDLPLYSGLPRADPGSGTLLGALRSAGSFVLLPASEGLGELSPDGSVRAGRTCARPGWLQGGGLQDRWVRSRASWGGYAKVPEGSIAWGGHGGGAARGGRSHLCCLGAPLLLFAGALLWLFVPGDPLRVEALAAVPRSSPAPAGAPAARSAALPEPRELRPGRPSGAAAAAEGRPQEHDCSEGLEDWSSSWSAEKKAWCCSHQLRGCESEPDPGCRAQCSYGNSTVPCRAVVQWMADAFASSSYLDPCRSAHDVVMVQCPACREQASACDFESRGCASRADAGGHASQTEPPVPFAALKALEADVRSSQRDAPADECQQPCELDGRNGTCASQAQRFAEEKFRGKQQPCALGLGVALYGCPACRLGFEGSSRDFFGALEGAVSKQRAFPGASRFAGGRLGHISTMDSPTPQRRWAHPAEARPSPGAAERSGLARWAEAVDARLGRLEEQALQHAALSTSLTRHVEQVQDSLGDVKQSLEQALTSRRGVRGADGPTASPWRRAVPEPAEPLWARSERAAPSGPAVAADAHCAVRELEACMREELRGIHAHCGRMQAVEDRFASALRHIEQQLKEHGVSVEQFLHEGEAFHARVEEHEVRLVAARSKLEGHDQRLALVAEQLDAQRAAGLRARCEGPGDGRGEGLEQRLGRAEQSLRQLAAASKGAEDRLSDGLDDLSTRTANLPALVAELEERVSA
ncbi:unnamed protein product, partial [Prorocentrum cordatum]